ncbi:hypothetical protein [Aquabacterium sp.]|uniref:hypothetical protein n=1 Tax=Aquabacterium sp. TaxID=1872578 RepID=UPI0024878F14|nr:hypothetical protein [Aquabacterium sp.]MDI1261269.1 hypothetical protein [Aquabacterium sp.]
MPERSNDHGPVTEAATPTRQRLALAAQEQGVPSTIPRGRIVTGPNMPNEAPSTKAILAQLAANGAHAAQAASIAVTTWTAMDVALSPIIGQRGFAALYKRSLQLTRVEFPCLATVQDSVLQLAEFSVLHAVLAQQSSATAAAASAALLENFYDILTTLIGRSLTDRLLRPVCETTSSGQPAQDTSP